MSMMSLDHGMSLGDYGSGLDHDAMLAAYGEAADPDTIATDNGNGKCEFPGCARTDTDLTTDWSVCPVGVAALCPRHNSDAEPVPTDDGGPPRVTVTTETDAALVAIALEDKARDCYSRADNRYINEQSRRFWRDRGDKFDSLVTRVEVARW